MTDSELMLAAAEEISKKADAFNAVFGPSGTWYADEYPEYAASTYRRMRQMAAMLRARACKIRSLHIPQSGEHK